MQGSAHFFLIAFAAPAMAPLDCTFQGQHPAHSKYVINLCWGNVQAGPGQYWPKEHLRFQVRVSHWN